MSVRRLRRDRSGRRAVMAGRRPGDGARRRSFLRVPEAVSHTADGEDVLRFLRIGLELLAEMADVDVDGAWVAVRGVAPHARQQHVARVDPPWIGGQRGEDL